MSAPDAAPLARTPLHALHVERGARMVPFAGWEMPVHFEDGVLAEHLWTRASAGLFDVSHMGQILVEGPGAADALERLVPADLRGLPVDRMRYTQLLAEDGGVLDDLMVTRLAAPGAWDRFALVVNASRREADIRWMAPRLLGGGLHVLDDRALLALQGPLAEPALEALAPGVANLPFMGAGDVSWRGVPMLVTRSGYTGEDGFEVSVPASAVTDFARALLADPRVKPVGLGARDSLRLEAGLCLYGHDIDETTSPVEAGLGWSIGKRRRLEGGFPGAARVQREFTQGPSRRRIGLALEGRQPAREGAEIVDAQGAVVGAVTSGGFAPSLGRAIAMGYVDAAHAREGASLAALVRGKTLPARVAPLPFHPHRYRR